MSHETKAVQIKLHVRALDAIRRGTEWLSAEDIAQRAAHSAELLSQWEHEGALFSIVRGGRRLYPAYAFDADFAPRAAVGAALAALKTNSPEFAAAFFESTSSFLNGLRPRELLAGNPDRVVLCALDERQDRDSAS